MVLSAMCPRCGTAVVNDVTLTEVTIRAGGRNIVVPCLRCGHEWDLTGGGDGTWSTDEHGRLRLIERLATASRRELDELREQVAGIAETQDQAAAVELTHFLGLQPTPKSRLTSGNEALDFVIKLGIVLGLLLQGGEWTIETVQRLVDHWFN